MVYFEIFGVVSLICLIWSNMISILTECITNSYIYHKYAVLSAVVGSCVATIRVQYKLAPITSTYNQALHVYNNFEKGLHQTHTHSYFRFFHSVKHSLPSLLANLLFFCQNILSSIVF